MPQSFSKIRSAAIDGRAQNTFYKKSQLKRLHDVLSENGDKIQNAIAKDTENRPVEVKIEYCLVLKCLASAYGSIDPVKDLRDEYAIANAQDAPNRREAVGIVVIEPAAHSFFFSLICAVASALAAGNCIIVQAEQSMLETPRLILGLIKIALDEDIFLVTYKELTDADVGHRHIRVLQNGCPGTPLANCIVSDPQSRAVAIVERDANIQEAAKALVAARFSVKGRSPYAPDVVLVNEWVKKEFLGAVTQQSIAFMANADDARTSKKAAGLRFLDEVMKEGFTNVIYSGTEGLILDIENRKSFLMEQKLQHNCLVIHAVTSMDDAIDVSKRFGRLAAAYVFTTPAAAKYICQFVDSNMSFVNHFPASLLFTPVAPTCRPFHVGSDNPYEEALFTLPSPQRITHSEQDRDISSILLGASPQQLQKLDHEAMEKLPEIKHLKKGRDVGFFDQAILTGGTLVVSVALSCGGILCYFVAKAARSWLQ